jgi:small subunit ribosomal protein S16
MAVKIRLRQQGRSNHKTYRLVACDVRVKRDGKYLENLGWYNPHLPESNAKLLDEKILNLLNLGGQMSGEAKALISREAPHVIKKWSAKRQAKRAKLAAKKRKMRKKSIAKA